MPLKKNQNRIRGIQQLETRKLMAGDVSLTTISDLADDADRFNVTGQLSWLVWPTVVRLGVRHRF